MLPELHQHIRVTRDQCSQFSWADVVVIALLIIGLIVVIHDVAKWMR